MNAEQKQYARDLVSSWKTARNQSAGVYTADKLAALLQELVDMPAQSVTGEELQAAFDRGLKAGNEQNDAQQVEIHRLHDLLAAAPTPPEPPADAAHELTLSSLRKKLGLPEHCAERRILCAIDELIAKQVPADVAQDAELLDALEDEVKSRGANGLTLGYANYAEDGCVLGKGFRVVGRKFIGPRKATLREAIDAAIAAEKGGA